MKSMNIAVKMDFLAKHYYHEHFDNAIYHKATKGKTSTYDNALINEAMAICGSPFYTISWRNWSKEAIDFLSLFERNVQRELGVRE